VEYYSAKMEENYGQSRDPKDSLSKIMLLYDLQKGFPDTLSKENEFKILP
jgi:hypothetical protein